MPVTDTLAALGRFIRRTPPPPPELLEAYAHEVIPILDRAEWLYQYWLDQSTLFSDSEKLGNVAAIHRWETATMGRSLEQVIPPAVLAGAHERVIDALEMASRAAQLLSSGSRFHNANAVCEGQALLVTSRDRRLDALKAMRRHLSAVVKPPEQGVEAGSAAVAGAAQAAEPVAAGEPPDAPSETDPQPTALPASPAGSDLPGSAEYPADPETPVDTELASDPLLHLDDLPATPLMDETEPPPGFLPPAPVEQAPAPDVTPAPEPAPGEDAVTESRGRPGWGSLFARPDDRPAP
jgi:hypothetical protein